MFGVLGRELADGARGQIEWRVVAYLAAGSIPAAAISVMALLVLKASGRSAEWLILPFLGLALVGTAISILIKHGQEAYPTLPLSQERMPVRLTVMVGAVIGVLVTFTSVGAGAIGVAALMMLYPSMRPEKVVGTDLAHAIPLITVAGLGHIQLGHVNYPLLLSLLVGSVPGIYFGSMLSSKLPGRLMQKLLVGILLTVGLSCIFFQ